MTDTQKQALANQDKSSSSFMLPLDHANSIDHNHVILDIGFGMGESLYQQAESTPTTLFIGVEVYLPGIGALLKQLQAKPLDNLKIVHADAQEVLTQLPASSIQIVQCFFPDPWPKRRHHKRRLLLQASFYQKMSECLVPKGLLHIMTDWQDYGNAILKTYQNQDQFTKLDDHPILVNTSNQIALTKYQCRGLKLGHQIQTFLYQVP